MFENFTTEIIAISAAVTTIGGAGALIYKFYKCLKAPIETLTEKVENLETVTLQNAKSLKKMNKVLSINTKATGDLLEHGATGNHNFEMMQRKKELDSVLREIAFDDTKAIE